MGSDRRIMISPGRDAVVSENGPLHLVIRAWTGDKFQTDPALAAAEFAFTCLDQVADNLAGLRELPALSKFRPSDPTARAMVDSVLALGDPELTPMASVAGAIADAVADFLFDRGCTRVIVDNGGDLAIRLAPMETARVGIRPDLNAKALSHILTLDGTCPAYGVNTSGFGGRSFTTGIASAATALASSSALADAAATSIANACFVSDHRISRIPADRISPLTDIPHIPVTVAVGALPPALIREALTRARARSIDYADSGLIIGAFVACGGQWTATDSFAPGRLEPLADNPPNPESNGHPDFKPDFKPGRHYETL